MKKLACLLSFMVMFAFAQSANAMGLLYSEVVMPEDSSFSARTYNKKGSSTCYDVLGLVAWGDCSINKAMKNGGLSHLHHRDSEKRGIIFFRRIITYVYGE